MAEIQAPSNKLKALQNLAGQLPVASQKVAQGQAAARDIQLQQAVKAAPTTTQTAAPAAQIGAAQTQQAGSQMIEQAKQTQAQLGQVAQAGLAQQGQEQQAKTASLQAGAKQQQQDQVQQLASISMQAKNELFDKQLTFDKDQAGRTLFNDRQLMDYAAKNARSNEEFKNYAQQAEQINKRALEAQEHAFKLIQQDLDAKQAIAEQNNDQDAAKQIAAARMDMQKRMANQKNKKNNRSAMYTSVGTGVGMVVGGVVAGYFSGGTAAPAGAAAGGAVGGSIGNFAASQENS